jgi:pilus assembly protein CpaE
MANRIVLVSEGNAAALIVPALEARGMAVTVVRDVSSALARLADHQLIILDASDASRLTLMCRQVNDAAGSRHAPILAIAHSRDVEARVRLLEAGADDVLAQPIDERELEALVDALLLRAPSAFEAPTPTGSVTPRPVQSAPGRVVAFAAAKGGSGTTTLAVNTALVLAEMAPGSVAIADFDMAHGQVSTHLDLYGRNSTAQMAREDRSIQNPEMIYDAGRQHPSGLMVFGGPYRPDEALDVNGEQLASLAEAFRPVFGTIVVDAGSTVDVRALNVLARADHVVMPITPDIPALRLLHAALQVMSEAGPIADRAIFVVNNIYAKPTIQAEQIEEHLGIRVSLEIPYDGENFLRAVNEGQPLMSLARRSPGAAAIRRLAELTAETRLDDEPMPAQRRGLFRGLLGRN